MSKHTHADLMMQYAQDAMTTDKPWELYQCLVGNEWKSVHCHLWWNPEACYRRKPHTININGFEVPEPVRAPLRNEEVYFVVGTTTNGPNLSRWRWNNDISEHLWLKRGLIHLTHEAAEIHTKALLSFTETPE